MYAYGKYQISMFLSLGEKWGVKNMRCETFEANFRRQIV